MIFLKKAPWFLCAAFIALTQTAIKSTATAQGEHENSFSQLSIEESNALFSQKNGLLEKLNQLEIPKKNLPTIFHHLKNPRTNHEQIWKIVNCYPWTQQRAPENDAETTSQLLNADACLLGSATDPILEILKLNASLPAKSHKIIVLSGSHELEKNLAAQRIVNAIGRPSYTINCDIADAESNFATGFAGSSSFTEQQGPGEILNALCTTGVINPIIIIKNLNALPKNELQNFFSCLNHDGSLQLHDNFMQFGINTAEISFIFITNSHEDIPKTILKKIESKTSFISLPAHRRDQKIDSTYKYLLPSQLNGYVLPQKTLESLRSCIPFIVDLSSPNNVGLAPVHGALSKVITHCAIKALQTDEPPFVLTNKILDELIPASPRDEFEMPLPVLTAIQQRLSDCPINGAAYQAAIKAFPWKKTASVKFEAEAAIKALSANHLGLNKQSLSIYEIIATLPLTPPTLRKAICIVGPSGTGKTTLAESTAKALSRPEFIIDLANNPSLHGEPLMAAGATPGALYSAFCATQTKAPVIILDNIDKSHVINIPHLVNVLNPKKNTRFADQFAGFDIDLSQAFFVATATDPSQIPAKLLDHLELVYLEGYTQDEKLSIAKKHFLPQALTGRTMTHLGVEELEGILPTLVKRIAPNDMGLHALNRVIKSLAGKQMSSIVCLGKTLGLTPQNVCTFIDPLLTAHHVSDAKDIQARCNEIINRLNLSAEQFKHIDSHITALKPWRGGDAITLLYMDWIERFPFNKTTAHNATPENALAQLDSTHFGLGNIKESIIDFLAGMHFSSQNGNNRANKSLCFVGGPGIGKTTISESIAKALERPFTRVALESVQSLKGGVGEHEMFGDGPGPIGRALCETGTLNPVILLDEIDKASPKVVCQLLELLDPAQNKTFRDSFLGFDLDLSQVIFIASANDSRQIPSPLRDRLHRINMEPYSYQERVGIAHNMIIPQISSSMGFSESVIQELHNLVQPLVEKIMRTEYGVRNLKRFLQVAADKYARMLLQERTTSPLSVSDVLGDLHAELLQTDPAKQPAAEAVIGITNGMYANGSDGGGICKIEASVIPFGKGSLIKTLLHGKSSQESHSRTLAYVKSLSTKYNINPEVFTLSDFLFSDQTYHKVDGPSAGVAQAVALISALTKRAVKPGYAMTGAIDAYGNLLPVGGYRAKILGTERAGIKNILLPECSRGTIEKIRKDFPAINITYIKTLDEAVEILLEPALQTQN